MVAVAVALAVLAVAGLLAQRADLSDDYLWDRARSAVSAGHASEPILLEEESKVGAATAIEVGAQPSERVPSGVVAR
jgi:hypothetical protein